ncbi:MAG: patatin-like phospholipase family protein [Nanoarchaeota archaeon]|nr:patatin-like phospholipase family protein [Nanoarchaeota archaeon]
MFERKKVGLALSGGGIKGLAHIGVLKVLEEYKVPIDYLAGTSVGSIIGAIYSAEPNAKKLEKEILDMKINSFFDYTLSTQGFIKGDKIEQYLNKRLKSIDFKDLKIPLFLTAFDVNEKREVIFSRGNVAKAARASISIPGVFIPVVNNNRVLVDGSIVDSVPTEILKKAGAEIIIAVNVNNVKIRPPIFNEEANLKNNQKKPLHVLECALRSLEVMGALMSEADLIHDRADLVINIDAEGMMLFEAKNKEVAQKIIKLGEKSARKAIKDIKKITSQHPLKILLEEINRIPNLKVKDLVKDVKKTLNKSKR